MTSNLIATVDVKPGSGGYNDEPAPSTANRYAWSLYILRCADGTLYTGVTNDLDKRVASHNAGTAAKYTRTRRPVELVFTERLADKSAALKREAAIKSMTRAEKLALISSNKK